MLSKSQSAAAAGMAHYGETLKELLANPQITNLPWLKAAVCRGIPIYNTFAALEGWPQIPLPAFCTPTPTP